MTTAGAVGKAAGPSVEDLFSADMLLCESDIPVSPAWEAEIQRRVEAYDRGEVKGIPADQVMNQIREKHGW